jgi:molybdenum cofactor synthesis domain-containing protein
MKKKIPVEEAMGKVLVHDVTRVDPDKGVKGPAFKKGHIITQEDIEKLKDLGKEYVYVLDLEPCEIHEDEAAVILAEAIMGENTYRDETPTEGKISIYSSVFGLVKIDVKRLIAFNSVGEPSCPTIHSHLPVKQGDTLAAVRIISLTTPQKEVEEAARIAGHNGIIRVVPFTPKRVGLIITGTEIYTGRIQEKFYPRLFHKLRYYSAEIAEKVILPDDTESIKKTILEFQDKYDMVLLTGGTSVDPDDVTYRAITEIGTTPFMRGNPIQPGNMLTMGWIQDKPVVAVPAAALFFQATALDIWLPRLLVGEMITREEVIAKSHGGLCHRCNICVFPVCPFGK